MNKELNVVYIGPQSFPLGHATTKRRRYMVDYMNSHGIKCHYLICDFKQRDNRVNTVSGKYGECDYYDITPLAQKKQFFQYWKKGKALLKDWFVEGKQNCLVFPTILDVFSYPFYRYARKLGYKIVFDQVETSYFNFNLHRIGHMMNVYVSEWLSRKAYHHSAAFVISKNLMRENEAKYPSRKMCLLPNSTPSLKSENKRRPHKPLRILYSGTYANKDGVKYLVEGFLEARKRNLDCELILLGKGNPENMKVIDGIRSMDCVHYLGFVSDEELIHQMQASDLLCMTRCNSRFANYGFPFKLSEYLATGNLVLATNVGDVCDFVKDKESALVIPSEDSKAIADAIQYAIENPAEALRIGNGGYEVMQNSFSVESVGKTFVNFLMKL